MWAVVIVTSLVLLVPAVTSQTQGLTNQRTTHFRAPTTRYGQATTRRFVTTRRLTSGQPTTRRLTTGLGTNRAAVRYTGPTTRPDLGTTTVTAGPEEVASGSRCLQGQLTAVGLVAVMTLNLQRLTQ